MGTISVEAEIDAEEVVGACDTEYLVKELVSRFDGERRKSKQVTPEQKKKLKEDLTELIQELGLEITEPQFKVVGLHDQLKLEHIQKVFDKYNFMQIEAALPL